MAQATFKKEHSALNATKTAAKLVTVFILLLATAAVVYLAS
jgi:hypothetical protein